MIERRKTYTVKVGNIAIGSGHPISIQSMVKVDTMDVDAVVCQLNAFKKAGCEIARVAVKHLEAAKAISDIKKRSDMPIVADIHFDPLLALEAIKNGIDKVRINPGNMSEDALKEVAEAALSKGVPVRVGVNSGSLPEGLSADEARDMSLLALKSVDIMRGRGLKDIVISLKASDVETTVAAYRHIASRTDCPLHLGVTAAGLPEDGIVRSSIGIGALLLDGIGDTIRVSLTGDPIEEVYTAKRILDSTGSRTFGPTVIACPTCGRCKVDLLSIVRGFCDKLNMLREEQRADLFGNGPFTIALMGCEVNGPGEAREADIGIAFGEGKGAIFRNGSVVKTVRSEDAIDELLDIIKQQGTVSADNQK